MITVNDQVKVNEKEPEINVLAQAPRELPVLHMVERCPSDWTIIGLDDNDEIEATNNKTSRVVVCTIQEFNKMLKG